MASREPPQRVASSGPDAPPGQFSILVVEDEPLLRETLDEILRSRFHGSVIVTAPDLRRARAVLADSIPAVLLVDRKLPDGDGLELVREVRDRRLDRVRIVMMTADESVREAARAAGADAFLAKPFAPSALVAALRPADLAPEGDLA